MSVASEPRAPRGKCGVRLSDFASGLYAAFSIAAMLVHVRSGGRSAHIDIPMFGCTWHRHLQTSEYFGNGRDPKSNSVRPTRANAPYQAFPGPRMATSPSRRATTSCGWSVLAWWTCRRWPKIRASSAPPTARANQGALKQSRSKPFTAKPVAHWIDAFNDAGCRTHASTTTPPPCPTRRRRMGLGATAHAAQRPADHGPSVHRCA